MICLKFIGVTPVATRRSKVAGSFGMRVERPIDLDIRLNGSLLTLRVWIINSISKFSAEEKLPDVKRVCVSITRGICPFE